MIVVAIFFLSSRSGFWGGWGWFNGLCSFWGGWWCVAFSCVLSFQKLENILHLKIFYIETNKALTT